MKVSVEQATQNALARWLARELDGVTVWDRWPEANVRLPAEGDLRAARRNAPRRSARSDADRARDIAGAPGRAVFTWRMRACTQPLQLDVWAHSDVARDDLLARLEPVLNASKARSMPSLGLT